MDVSLFDYELPPELIAQDPLPDRDRSRLMVMSRKHGDLEHRFFYNVLDYLKPGDALVLNNTRVIPARLLGQRADSGGKVEVFLLRRLEQDDWEVLVKPGRRVRVGAVVTFGSGLLRCQMIAETEDGGRIARFAYNGDFDAILAQVGEVPLPPYIKQHLQDGERYQTVYNRHKGSVAAPTAGLHFTPGLLQQIRTLGVTIAYVTLHVGLGTFRPVSVSDITQHTMHKEYYDIPAETCAILAKTKQAGGRVIAVGTTVTRTLESAAVADGTVTPQQGWTDIFIYPGYQFKVLDGLITNFHLPCSTLLMLVSAFTSREQVLDAYRTAVQQRYRFFSFGDAMLII